MEKPLEPVSIKLEPAYKVCREAIVVGLISLVLTPYSHWVPVFPPIANIICIHAIIQSVRLRSRRSRWLAVIGLLASTLSFMPAVMMMSDAQKGHELWNAESCCLSNTRQIGLAMRVYADDNDSSWPLASHWRPLVRGYIGHQYDGHDVFQCPIATDTLYSYGMNINMSGNIELTTDNGSKTAAVFDCALQQYNASGGRASVDFRHQRGPSKLANFVFTDGHAKAVINGKSRYSSELGIDQVRWKP